MHSQQDFFHQNQFIFVHRTNSRLYLCFIAKIELKTKREITIRPPPTKNRIPFTLFTIFALISDNVCVEHHREIEKRVDQFTLTADWRYFSIYSLVPKSNRSSSSNNARIGIDSNINNNNNDSEERALM